jgi:hypothetical protein
MQATKNQFDESNLKFHLPDLQGSRNRNFAPKIESHAHFASQIYSEQPQVFPSKFLQIALELHSLELMFHRCCNGRIHFAHDNQSIGNRLGRLSFFLTPERLSASCENFDETKISELRNREKIITIKKRFH